MGLVDLAPLIDAPKPGQHTYGRKLRRAIVPMSTLAALLSLDGQRSYKMSGWPEGARIVGCEVLRSPFAVVLFLYHPDFPAVPMDELPEIVKVTATAVG